METFVQRLIAERDELQDKMEKLQVFIESEKFKELTYENQALLKIQYNAMKTYKEVLDRRININKNV